MSTKETTDLPYVFDLLYDFKTVEQLHDHLTGKARFSTSGTDRDLVTLMVENDIPLPEGYLLLPGPTAAPKEEHLRSHYEELLEVVRQLHVHAKRQDADDRSTMDSVWVLETTGKTLAKQSGLTEEQREAYENPSPFVSN